MQGDETVQSVARFIHRHNLLPDNGRVLAAVSGGADSLALLHLLLKLGYAVEVAHFDHQTRTGASAADAAFVERAAALLGVPFHLESGDIGAIAAATPGTSFEMAAREARYAFLLRAAVAQGIPAIATGHQQDDQAETVLMQLLRGAGALRGIAPWREEGGVAIVRPLLDCSGARLRAWLKTQQIAWREDTTNAALDHHRNRIRHQLVPLLETFNPRAREALARLAHAQRLDAAYLEEAAAAVFTRCVSGDTILAEPFSSLDPALQRHVLIRFLSQHGAETRQALIEDLVALLAAREAGARVDVDEQWFVYRAREGLLLRNRELTCDAGPVELCVPGCAVFQGRTFHARRLAALPAPARTYCSPARQVLPAKYDRLILRSRRRGDRFRPLGTDGSRKLSDYFIDRGVPEPLRDEVPLLCAGDQILWVVGHAIDASSAIEPNAPCTEVTVNDDAG